MSQIIDTKLPALTKEERSFYGRYNAEFFRRYNLHISLHRKIASALHALAINKLLGIKEFEKNKDEAVQHHLKACEYDPHKACVAPSFRKSVGLKVIEACEACTN